MSEVEDIWHDQEQYTPLGVARRSRENENLKGKLSHYQIEAEKQIKNFQKRLEEATKLLQEAVDRYPVEQDSKLWTSRVRKWLKDE